MFIIIIKFIIYFIILIIIIKLIILVFVTTVMGILENPKNLAVTKNCRYKVAFLKKSEEHLYDAVERLVDEQIKREGITIPPMPKDY